MTFGLGLGLGLGSRGAGGPAYDAAALAYFDAMSVQPDAARKALINAFIVDLKDEGLWAKMDGLAIRAAHDAQAGLVDVVDPARVATNVNSMSFAADSGYTGDGAASYLDTGFNPTLHAVNFAQNSAFMFTWVQNEVTGSVTALGNTLSGIQPRTSATNFGGAPNSGSFSSSTGGTTSIGSTAWSRTGASAGRYYKNGAPQSAISTASTALRNAAFFVGARNHSSSGGSTPDQFSTHTVGLDAWGSQLSDAEQLTLHNLVSAFMAAL